MLEKQLILLFTHYIFDFILQSRIDAENKSKSLFHLSRHVFQYSIGLLIFGACFNLHTEFYFVNTLCHWIIDYFTSRLSSYAYQNKKMKLFWSTIGFDQFIHTATLLWTLKFFSNY